MQINEMSSRIGRLSLAAAMGVLALASAAASAQKAEEIREMELDARSVPQVSSRGVGTRLTCEGLEVPADFYFNDFETDDGGWTSGGAGDWEWGEVISGVGESCAITRPEPAGAFSGSNAWATNLDGCYANSGSIATLTRTFDFTSLGAPIELNVQHWLHVFGPFDTAEVVVNGDQLFLEDSSVQSSSYAPLVIDLSAYAGMPSVTIEFNVNATTVVNRSGWYLDDMAITSCVVPTSDVAITKMGPASAAPGDSLTYTIDVSNNGPSDALDVTVNESFPAALSFNSATAPCAGGFPCNLGTLANGAAESFDVTFDIAPDATGSIENTASVSTTTDDPDGSNDSSTALTNLAAEADLLLAKDVGAATVESGGTFDYLLEVTNQGPSTARNVVITDNLPAQVVLDSSTGCAEDPGGVPTCTIGDLAPGESATAVLSVAVVGGSRISTNSASVDSDATDPVPANNSASADVLITLQVPASAPMSLALLALILLAVPVLVRGRHLS